MIFPIVGEKKRTDFRKSHLEDLSPTFRYHIFLLQVDADVNAGHDLLGSRILVAHHFGPLSCQRRLYPLNVADPFHGDLGRVPDALARL